MKKRKGLDENLNEGFDILCRRKNKTLAELIADDIIMDPQKNLYKYLQLKAKFEDIKSKQEGIEDPDSLVRDMLNGIGVRDTPTDSATHRGRPGKSDRGIH